MEPQPPPPDITGIGTWGIWAFIGGLAASFSALRKKVKMGVTLYHVSLASFISAWAPYIFLALWPQTPWYVGVPISAIIGLTIFGIAVMIERTDRRVENIDPTQLIPGKRLPEQPGASNEH